MEFQSFSSNSSSFSRERGISPFKGALDCARTRLLIASVFFCFATLIIAGRLFMVTVLRDGAEPALVEQDLSKPVYMGRANITDRNGEVLATTIITSSLHANCKIIQNPQVVADRILTVLPNLKRNDLIKRLSSNRRFIWIARHLTPGQRLNILRLGIPGLSFMRDERRIYPQGRLAAHILGYTDVDNHGISGVEKSLDTSLRTKAEPVQLSLDLRLQHILKDEISKGIQEFGARGGCGIIFDVSTGEVLGMTSLPDFDPNHASQATQDELFNKVTLGIYEMGSTMKVTNTAMALESGAVTLASEFDATHPLQVGRFKVTDFRGRNEWLNVAKIFVYSSNIGAAKMALKAGSEKQKNFMQKLGYLNAPQFELPEVGAPLLPKIWNDPATITISYGYGLSISPLQLVTGVGTIIGGGLKKFPTLLKRQGQAPQGERVVSEKTSRIMRELMRLVVKNGTSRKANVPGYMIFAKTGTANLRAGRGYQKDKVMVNFVGVLGNGYDKPRYIVYVMLDDPKRLQKTYGFNNAGWNAAPIGGRIIARMAPILGLAPSDKEDEMPDAFLRSVKF
ncbi:MAG: penicillin-binding protein 2 [Candidatus Paracaedimonas acanthamoebae]|uniref:Penicillin-binding protein 2 n=1 Tax=Candidatus Paracaedimonas acanthamoebae TaxID=244581 RepID=A0A8J7PWU1_9PROT|nr:penicillin-binding protein 2 [Candidatus Paracaedimonas acanthamoebae]